MSTNENPERTGVVVHVDEGDQAKHESVLTNIANLLQELGAATPVELVVHGPGLALARSDGSQAARVSQLLERGITVSACANTMRGQGIEESALIHGVRVVPAGIAQLVRRQREGWAYVRP